MSLNLKYFCSDESFFSIRSSKVKICIRNPSLNAISMAGLIWLAGCSGTMTGAVRETGQPISIEYEQGMDSDTLKASIDGETFVGKSVMKGASATFGTAFDNTNFGMVSLLGQTTTGDFVAVLLGSRGSSLNCNLQYADSSGVTSSGGVGVCKHSDGRIIDFVW